MLMNESFGRVKSAEGREMYWYDANIPGAREGAEQLMKEDNGWDERTWRKQRPLATGVLDYFPDALLEVAYCSWVGNEQHNPGQKLHWDRSKSTDEADALLRHLSQRGTIDTDGVRHSAKTAWRALSLLQREIEAERVTPATHQHPPDYGEQ